MKTKFKWYKYKGKRTNIKIWKRKGKRHKLDCGDKGIDVPCYCDFNKAADDLLKKVTRLLN